MENSVSRLYAVNDVGPTSFVLGDIEFAEDDDGFIPFVSIIGFEFRMCWMLDAVRKIGLPMNIEHNENDNTDSLTFSTLPHPPNRSFAHPTYTCLMPICRRAEAHMIHGSTVT